VVAAEENAAALEPRAPAVRETWPIEWRVPRLAENAERILEREAAESDDDPHAREQPELLHQVRQAAIALGRRGTVVGRRAAHHRGHPGVAQTEAVAARQRGRLIRESRAVKRSVEPVAAPISREDASRAVAAVRGRGQADDQQVRS
jgi:hypothetical protein